MTIADTNRMEGFECRTCGGCTHEHSNPFYRCNEWAPLPLYAEARIRQCREKGHDVWRYGQPESHQAGS